MAERKFRLPMGMAGITRFDEAKSKITFSPGNIILLCVAVIVIILGLHLFL